jgi:hypothetical protein
MRVDAAGHRGLETQVHFVLGGEAQELVAVMGHELLVGGDHGLPRGTGLADPAACRVEPADHLDDDVDLRRQHGLERLGPVHRGRDPVDALSSDVTVEDVREAQRSGRVEQEPGHGLSDRTEPEQGDVHVDATS